MQNGRIDEFFGNLYFICKLHRYILLISDVRYYLHFRIVCERTDGDRIHLGGLQREAGKIGGQRRQNDK